MRVTVRPENFVEWVARLLNLGPVPLAEAMLGMATARVIMAGVRLGLYRELARRPGDAADLADRLGLNLAGTRHLLECLTALGIVRQRRREYYLTRRAARWLDPASPTYVGDFLEFNYDQWDWWSRMEEVVRTGQCIDIHAKPPDDPFWQRYITAMFQLARIAAPEVARRLRLPPQPQHLLDLGGGHGWYAAILCQRYPTLQTTVIDLPGAIRIGRNILTQAGLQDRFQFVEGDALTVDPLPGPCDGVLCFQLIHHLTPEQNVVLFQRIAQVLTPGGTLAVLDYLHPPLGHPPSAQAFLGLHFHLTSAASTYSEDDLRRWLQTAGFTRIRSTPLRRIPILRLVQAVQPAGGHSRPTD